MSTVRRRPSVLTQADTLVRITTACRLIDMPLPDLETGRNTKVHCPFGEVYHSDGGVEPAMRIYIEGNHAHCFAGCGTFGPVKLVATAWDMPMRAAARELLSRAGIAPETLQERWKAAQEPDESVDVTLLAEALKTYCRRTDPQWLTRQFEPATARRLGACLALLDRVHTYTEATRWLDACKTIMSRALDADTPTD